MLVSSAKGRLFRRTDGKYLIYLPVHFCEDSMFPFKEWEKGARGGGGNIPVKVSFKVGDNKLLIEKWKERDE